MLIERWYRNSFLQCIQIQVRNLIKGISDLMVLPRLSTKYQKQNSYTTLWGKPEPNFIGYTHNEESQIPLLPPSCYRSDISPKEVTPTPLTQKNLTRNVAIWFLSFYP